MKTKLFLSIPLLLLLGGALLAKEVAVPAGINHEGFDRLLEKYVNDRGLVAYEKWQASVQDRKALEDYTGLFATAGNPATGNDRYASLINGYNAFVIEWILENYPTESIWTLKSSFKEKRYRVGGTMVSLNQIENDNLRPEFGYRTHAVLVCAARSCPPLQQSAYTAASLDDQVARAFRTWLARPDLNEFYPDKNEANVSSIFKWFKKDFASVGGAKAVMAKFAPAPARPLLENSDSKLTYKPYNWGLNDQGPHGQNYKANILDFLH